MSGIQRPRSLIGSLAAAILGLSGEASSSARMPAGMPPWPAAPLAIAVAVASALPIFFSLGRSRYGELCSTLVLAEEDASATGSINLEQHAAAELMVVAREARSVPMPPSGSGDGSGRDSLLPDPESPVEGQDVVTAQDLLAWRRRLLQSGGSSADLDWLLDLAGGLSWSELQKLWLQPQRQVVLRRGRSALQAIWSAYLQGEGPLQYLVGCCPWRDLTLEVGPGVLIPRQETELVVELLLDTQRGDRLDGNGVGRGHEALPPRPAPALWADLGTGSGCLAIALARAFPASSGLAVDICGVALAQAGRNLDRLGLRERITLMQGSWWAPLRPWRGQLEVVVANPPYIPSNLIPQLDPMVRDHEPRLALDGGADGLASLKSILAEAPRALAPGGLLLVEHHVDQSAAVLALMEHAGLHHPLAHRDIEGVPRFASACRPRNAAEARSGRAAREPFAPTGIARRPTPSRPGQGRASSQG